ncbi:hypothetical protein BpHYR1_001599 [Brachionus plicatilis]|uniref:Uncharacterized protein n=1 Tax=Brachionus plicatilis TaxID=10195 RepID=A0A3M7S0E7_BRAPC|nr:hypothetical protein BpHYR1_001599 [Brachionus plicatilis]
MTKNNLSKTICFINIPFFLTLSSFNGFSSLTFSSFGFSIFFSIRGVLTAFGTSLVFSRKTFCDILFSKLEALFVFLIGSAIFSRDLDTNLVDCLE